MAVIHLAPASTRAELISAHETLSNEASTATADLHLGTELHPVTANQYSAWMQLILTWGQGFESRRLHVHQDTIRRFGDSTTLSDLEVLAAVLATVILDPNGQDVTAYIVPLAERALEERDVLTDHTGDGPMIRSSSILLAGHTFTNSTSPELHELWNSELRIEESARTLYHDVWPDDETPTELRKPLLELGEVGLPEDAPAPSHVSRIIPPASHPRLREHDTFVNLGSRAPQARGLAAALAMQVRQRVKPIHDEIGEILFELIQNTEWHASAWAGGSTGANCRVIHFQEHRYTREALKSTRGFDPQFYEYASAVANFGRERSSGYVERAVFGSITVIDSGIGLAKSVALSMDEGDLLSRETEVGYLIHALRKSLKVRRADMGNIGLPRVQQCLTNLRGFMSVRSGGHEIMRDFVAKPFAPLKQAGGREPTPLFVDWLTGSDDFWVGPRIGTAITVVYPVNFEVRA